MKICFYAYRSLPIHADSLKERPLGGTETGIIRVADVLAEMGHQVVIVTSHPNPQIHNRPGGPIYLPPQYLTQFVEFDAMIVVQFWQPLLDRLPCKNIYFWTGDGMEQYSNLGIGDPRIVSRVKRLFVASNWHRQTLCKASGFPEDKCIVVGNGVFSEYFTDEILSKTPRHPKRLIYTSAPYRGLELAVRYFTILRSQIPDLEFHIFSGFSIYERGEQYKGPYVDGFESLKNRIQHLEGIKLHGNIRQKELAVEYCKSRVLLYPNIIDETCCIIALEAQAAGCVVVASENSALPESVGDGGVVIPGEPGSEEYSKALLTNLYRLMTDDLYWLHYSRNGRRRILADHTWKVVAERIERELL